ncbi:hypothetical protein [Mycolicibacterium hippocampi]|jgi:hypothetical protein|uniref:DUF4190 domain-containing protein n=1 Tax=Mycolicibacterium hippocampi TaxID=659824 RepID=A0A850PG24_9MYCO|nr:hypothetical protein [Mycolicibacterium hippocampi]NVN49042.1 hypothetical protein [Mycolicibacterium hippocampi]
MTPPLETPTPAMRNGVGTAALILGVISITFTFVPIVGDFVALPAAVCAIIAGVVGSGRVDRRQATNRGAALAGGALGVLTLLLALVIFAVVHGLAQS